MTDIVERLRARASRIRGYIASSELVVSLLQPEMTKFDARDGSHDLYTVRVAVDHKSSIRTQTKEAEELEQAADIIEKHRVAVEVAIAAINLTLAAQSKARALVPVDDVVERVTKAIMFADSGSTEDWALNTDLGKAALNAIPTPDDRGDA